MLEEIQEVPEALPEEEKRPFVTCVRFAQAGNQMFQIAATIVTALKNGADYLIPPFTSNNSLWPPVMTHLPQYSGEKHEISVRHREDPGFNYKPIEYTPNMCLDGYWQSWKHIEGYEAKLRKAFGFRDDFHKGVVAIHHRLSDYRLYPNKHPIPDFENYYLKAISMFPDHKFMVFSDDPEWVKEQYSSMENGRFIFMSKRDAIEDMKRMASCEHFIIANSTYSWWGAFLCANPDKIVVSPSSKNWFGSGNNHLTTDHIIPENWIQIEYPHAEAIPSDNYLQ